jgi:hypothetical protein
MEALGGGDFFAQRKSKHESSIFQYVTWSLYLLSYPSFKAVLISLSCMTWRRHVLRQRGVNIRLKKGVASSSGTTVHTYLPEHTVSRVCCAKNRRIWNRESEQRAVSVRAILVRISSDNYRWPLPVGSFIVLPLATKQTAHLRGGKGQLAVVRQN